MFFLRTRRCVGTKKTNMTHVQKVLMNDIIRTTPLERWIKSNSAVHYPENCLKK